MASDQQSELDLFSAPEPSERQVSSHFLGWHRPLLELATEHLARDWESGPLDLSRLVLIVPTRNASRRLRECLAIHASQKNTGVLSPLILNPDDLLVPPADALPTATKAESLAAWIEVLLEQTSPPSAISFQSNRSPKIFLGPSPPPRNCSACSPSSVKEPTTPATPPKCSGDRTSNPNVGKNSPNSSAPLLANSKKQASKPASLPDAKPSTLGPYPKATTNSFSSASPILPRIRIPHRPHRTHPCYRSSHSRPRIRSGTLRLARQAPRLLERAPAHHS